jgi:hypothetical protein
MPTSFPPGRSRRPAGLSSPRYASAREASCATGFSQREGDDPSKKRRRGGAGRKVRVNVEESCSEGRSARSARSREVPRPWEDRRSATPRERGDDRPGRRSGKDDVGRVQNEGERRKASGEAERGPRLGLPIPRSRAMRLVIARRIAWARRSRWARSLARSWPELRGPRQATEVEMRLAASGRESEAASPCVSWRGDENQPSTTIRRLDAGAFLPIPLHAPRRGVLRAYDGARPRVTRDSENVPSRRTRYSPPIVTSIPEYLPKRRGPRLHAGSDLTARLRA